MLQLELGAHSAVLAALICVPSDNPPPAFWKPRCLYHRELVLDETAILTYIMYY